MTSSMKGLLGSQGYQTGLGNSGQFPSPFLDYASTAMPEDMRNALRWTEYVFQANGTFRMAMERIIAYFLTDIEVGSVDDEVGDDEKEKWEDLFTNNLALRDVEQSANRDLLCYGNSFLSFVIPFTRFLVCPRCSSQFKLSEVFHHNEFKFNFTNFEFTGTCPKCKVGSGYRGKWKIHDEPENRQEKLKLKRWSPHEIYLLHDPFTDDVDYLWKIPEDYKNLIRGGKLYHLERVSKQVLSAIQHNQLFRFAPNVIYHMKEPTLAGVRNRGWGISRIISNFRQIWYVQVLHRYNEAIALDYVIPFRLITPAMRSGSKGTSTDVLLSANMGDSMAQIRRMLGQRRRNPTGWHTLGFPVEYQALGGDASQLAPSDLLNQGIEVMLNAAGTPVELYKGTLQLQTAPVSLRLFESTWHHLVHANNQLLRWVVERVSEVLNWESVDARHRRVTHADDFQRTMSVLQLAMGGAISMGSALKTLGLDYGDEQRRIMEEARGQQEEQASMQEEMEQTAFGQQIAAGQPAGGMMPGGQPGQAPGIVPGGPAGAPPAAAGGAVTGVDPTTGQPMSAGGPVTQMVDSGSMPTTPEEMWSQAASLAQALLGLPESQKDSELRALKQKNETLHALVRAQLDQIRGQARSQGGAQLMQQQFGT